MTYLHSSLFICGLTILAPLYAAVDGTVINQTTGKPQAGVVVNLIQPSQQGMQTIGSIKTGPDGKFKIEKNAEPPVLVQAIYGGVPYNKMIPPGTPGTGIEMSIFDSTNKPGTAKMSQHMVLLQPNDKGLLANEMYLVSNDTHQTYDDPAKGTLQFYLPPGHGDVRVTISAPGGMPIQRPAEPAGPANVFKVAYPIRPGETRFDLTYSVETATKEFAGKIIQKGGATRLVVPKGVTLEGANIDELGVEPQTQAKVYGVKGDAYTVKVAGTGSLALGGNPGGDSGGPAAGPEEDTGQPPLQQSNPRIYDKLYIILGLAFAILALGFVILYRSQPVEPKG
jgi:hypothetical protein